MMSVDERIKGRRRMLYYYILWALQMKRYAVIREWIPEYLVPLILLSLEKQGVRIEHLERDPEVPLGWYGLSEMLEEAANDLEIIRWEQGTHSFIFMTDKERLLKVINSAEDYFRRDERAIIEKSAKQVVELLLGNVKFTHAERLFKQNSATPSA